MKAFFAATALVFFTAALANSSVKPTPNSNQMRKAQYHMNYNTNFYAGPNCKKTEQQLAEIKNDIKAMKRNATRQKNVKGPKWKNIEQQLTVIKKEILEEIRDMKWNKTEENALKVL